MESKPCAWGITSRLSPLAVAQGADKLCELFEREARLSFNSDAQHQQADWVGIHKRICQLLIPNHQLKLTSLQQADCSDTRDKKVELMEIFRSVAQIKLSEGKHQESLPAAQLCLCCSIDVYGSSTVQMVPSYLLLAEANMGLGNLSQVAELLSQAEWAVLKSPHHPPPHQLYRSLGRLHTATGNLDTALFNFAKDIFFASEQYGLESTVTAGGFFLMADVFAKQGKLPTVHSLYCKVAHAWHLHLTKLFKTHVQNVQHSDTEASYDKAQQVEVDKMLQTMLDFEHHYVRKDCAQVALVAQCLAMLWLLRGHSVKAMGFGSMALQASQLIPNRDLTEPIQGLLQLVQSLQTQSHPASDQSPELPR